MSCNSSVPVQEIAEDVRDAIAGYFITKENPTINNGVFNSPTLKAPSIRGDVILDTKARNAILQYITPEYDSSIVDEAIIRLDDKIAETVGFVSGAIDDIILGDYQTQLEQKVDSQGGAINAQQSEISAQRLDIDTQQGEISAQRLDIDTQQSEISAQRLDIDTQQSEISAQRLDIDAVQSKIEAQKLDTGIEVTAKGGSVGRNLSDRLSDNMSIKDFGVVGDGSDETAKLRAYHNYCNIHKISASYAGLVTVTLDANAQIDIHSDLDFSGCVLRLLFNANATARSVTYKVLDPDRPGYFQRADLNVADLKVGSVTPTRDAWEGTGFVQLYSEKPTCGRSFGDAPLSYTQPFWAINGEVIRPLCTDLSTYSINMNMFIREASNTRLKISNVCLADDGFDLLTLIKVERNQVDIDSFIVLSEASRSTDTLDILISWSRCGCCTISNVLTNGRAYATGGTYVMSMSGVAEMTMTNIYGLDGLQKNATWGVTGSNYVSGCYLYNCSFNRFDVHAMGFYIYQEGGTVRKNCMQIGSGGGVFSVKGVTVIRAAAFQIRTDYGAQYENCDIVISDIDWYPVINSTKDNAALVNLGGARVGMGGTEQTKVPNIDVSHIRVHSKSQDTTQEFCTLFSLKVRGGTVVGTFNSISFSDITLPERMRWAMDVDFKRLDGSVVAHTFSRFNLSNIQGHQIGSYNAGLPLGVHERDVTPVTTKALNIKVKLDNVVPFAMNLASSKCLNSIDATNCKISHISNGAHTVDTRICNSIFSGNSSYNALAAMPKGDSHIYNSSFTGAAAYDLTEVDYMQGVIVTPAVVLPVGCTQNMAFTGWTKVTLSSV